VPARRYASAFPTFLRVTGTIRNPSVSIDPTIVVTDTALAFFAGVLKLPLGLVK
jgi:hypothetical protein